MHQRPHLSHRDAHRIVEAVRTELDRANEGAAVAVVDEHGELLAFLRTDGCRLPSIGIAINKAYTAAREGVESTELGRRSATEGFPMTNFGELRYVTWGGGVPLRSGDVVIGAVGVSGLPEARDIELARIGAAAIA